MNRYVSIEAGEQLMMGELVWISRRRVWWKPWTWFLKPIGMRVTSLEPVTMTYKDEDNP